MTTATIEKELKKHRPHDGQLFRDLALRLFPREIKDRETFEQFSRILDLLSDLLAGGKVPARSREAIEIYFGAVSHFVAEYERAHIRTDEDISAEEVLAHLVEVHNLKQSDLADDLGGQSVVSQVLRGERRLNRDQIERLAKRFRVSPALFFPAVSVEKK